MGWRGEREGKEGERGEGGGGRGRRGSNGERGRDGGRGTNEAHSPGLVVAPIHPCVLAIVRERPSWFVGGRPRSQAVVLVRGRSSSCVGVRLCLWAFVLASGHSSLWAVAWVRGWWWRCGGVVVGPLVAGGGSSGPVRSCVVGAPCCRVAMFVLSSWRCRLGTWSFAGAVSSLVGAGCRGHLFVVLSWCCVVHVIAVRREWETDRYLLERPRCGTDATSSPPSTRGCCCRVVVRVCRGSCGQSITAIGGGGHWRDARGGRNGWGRWWWLGGKDCWLFVCCW